MTIKEAKAVYTGGGIYIFYGRFTDGTFFRTNDDSDVIEICNEDTSTEEADYDEFYEKHRIRTLSGEDSRPLFCSILKWIITNKPKGGNYSELDLLKRLEGKLNPATEPDSYINVHEQIYKKRIATVGELKSILNMLPDDWSISIGDDQESYSIHKVLTNGRHVTLFSNEL